MVAKIVGGWIGVLLLVLPLLVQPAAFATVPVDALLVLHDIPSDAMTAQGEGQPALAQTPALGASRFYRGKQ